VQTKYKVIDNLSGLNNLPNWIPRHRFTREALDRHPRAVGSINGSTVMLVPPDVLSQLINIEIIDNFAYLNNERHQLVDTIEDLEAENLRLREGMRICLSSMGG